MSVESSVRKPAEFWSDTQEEVVVSDAATDRALPDIVVEGATIVARAVLFFAFRAIEETSGNLNMLDGNQYIQIRLAGGLDITKRRK